MLLLKRTHRSQINTLTRSVASDLPTNSAEEPEMHALPTAWTR